MSNTKMPENKQTTGDSEESDYIEAVVADIEGLCGHVMCEHFFIRLANLDAMAVACERHPKVLRWWQLMLDLGHPNAPIVWSEIKSRMDARAIARGERSKTQISEPAL